MGPGVVEVDLHGKTARQAQIAVDAQLRRATAGTYRLRVVHGHWGGTALRDMLQEVYGHHPKVRRLVLSPDGGSTDLVLREY